MLDARPLIARLTTTTSAVDGATAATAAMTTIASPPLRIKDVVARIREILLRDFVLTVTLPPRRRVRRRDGWYNGGGGDGDDNRGGGKNGGGKRSKFVVDDSNWRRESDSGDDTTAVATAALSPPPLSTFARTNRIEFDYDEGEGEIKAINWLSDYCGNGRARLIMARDNDVFVYILSKLGAAAISAPSPPSLPLLPPRRQRQQRLDCSWRRGDEYEEKEATTTGVVEPNSILMYHEGSNDVLLCWKHLSAYYDKCWILLLWMSVCFGNDFTFGILDKSVTSVSYYYSILERHFINVHESFATLNINDETSRDDRSGAAAITAATTTDDIISHLTKAFCELRNVLCCRMTTIITPDDDDDNSSGSGGDDDDDDSTDDSGCCSLTTIDNTNNSDVGDDKRRNDAKEEKDEYLRLWMARQLWSFFYILELPNEFTKNQNFRICPTLRINASFDKPFMSHETFVRLQDIDFRRNIESVVLYGL